MLRQATDRSRSTLSMSFLMSQYLRTPTTSTPGETSTHSPVTSSAVPPADNFEFASSIRRLDPSIQREAASIHREPASIGAVRAQSPPRPVTSSPRPVTFSPPHETSMRRIRPPQPLHKLCWRTHHHKTPRESERIRRHHPCSPACLAPPSHPIATGARWPQAASLSACS